MRAATEELQTTASGWHALAGELTGAAPTVSGVSYQPSAAAVTAIHAAVAGAGEAFGARAQTTAAETAAAATAYAQNEASSADLLNAVTESL